MPTFEVFNLPDAGEGLTEADIITWLVAEGDTVEVNQAIVEIETAKSLVELPSPYDGIVSRLLVAEGETVEVGAPIVEFDVDPGGTAAPVEEAPAAAAVADALTAETPTEPAPAATASGLPLRPVPVAAPDADDEIVAPTAEPAPPAPAAVEQVVPALEPLAEDAPAESPEYSNPQYSGRQGAAADPETGAIESPGPVLVGYGVSVGSVKRRERVAGSLEPVGGADDNFPVLAKPPVRKLAADLGIDLTTVTPSGPGGIVTREDVEQHAKVTSARSLATYAADDQPWLESGYSTPDGRATRVPVKSVRKRTAEAMVRSAFTAPHVTVFHTVDVTATMDLVARLKADREFADVRVTPLLIVAKALLLAARRHPEINASWDEATQEIVYKHYINLGIAASTPRGLVVPNIKDAHRLPLHTLAERLQELTVEARAGRATPSSLSDGTITITNVGALGIDTGTPILNPGEAAILAFGAIRQQPWVHDGEIQVRWVTQLALSFDHRLVDGELGSRVLADVARVMNDPAHGLLWG